jgi:hypothetical protein
MPSADSARRSCLQKSLLSPTERLRPVPASEKPNEAAETTKLTPRGRGEMSEEVETKMKLSERVCVCASLGREEREKLLKKRWMDGMEAIRMSEGGVNERSVWKTLCRRRLLCPCRVDTRFVLLAATIEFEETDLGFQMKNRKL